jgi:cytochrome P450
MDTPTPRLPMPPGLEFIRACHRAQGDMVPMGFGPLSGHSLNHPDLIREVLVEKSRSFIRWERCTEVFGATHGRGLLTTEGADWERQRRMLQPAFGRQRLDALAEQMAEVAAPALDVLAAGAAVPIDHERTMAQLTMAVTLQALFGPGAERDAATAAEAVKAISPAVVRELMLPPGASLPPPLQQAKDEALKRLDDLVRRHVSERRTAAAAQHDVLALLCSAQDTLAGGHGLDDQELRDHCMTLLLAGHDSTTSALTWWGWAMAAHPELARRAAAEVDAVLGGRRPVHADVPQLEYLGRTLKEAMRLLPPTSSLLTRQAVEDVAIGGRLLPRGSLVRITPLVVQRDARWFPDPERFDPERFAPGRVEQIPRGAYLPFGIGPRVCIASLFATLEMTLIAALLLQRFEFGLVPGAPPPRPVLNVTLHPERGLDLLLSPRAPRR